MNRFAKNEFILPQNVQIIVVRLENMTARVDILKSRGRGPQEAHVVGVSEKGLEIEFAERSCVTGHLVLLDLVIFLDRQKVQMTATAQIKSIRTVAERNIIEIRFNKYEKTLWDKVFNAIYDRQDKISQLFEAMKGS